MSEALRRRNKRLNYRTEDEALEGETTAEIDKEGPEEYEGQKRKCKRIRMEGRFGEGWERVSPEKVEIVKKVERKETTQNLTYFQSFSQVAMKVKAKAAFH